MENFFPSYIYQDMVVRLFSDIQESQKSFLNHWQTPFELSLNSISAYTDFTSNTIDYFTSQHQKAYGYYKNNDDELAVNPVKRIALVTGGIGGIGTEICKKLYKNNMIVISTFINQETDKANDWQQKYYQEGYEFNLIECDVTDFKACKKVSRQLEKNYGNIDILVNCAGITRDATLKKMEADHWHAVLDVNLDSVFNVTRNVINGMIKKGFGRIINISSVNGQKGQFGQTNYSAAKAGMIGFTKSLALELADNGITVNCVCPGYVGTSMVEAIPEDIKNDIIAKIPVGRLARPEEIGQAVAFLASDESGYITGSELSVNGGLFTGKT